MQLFVSALEMIGTVAFAASGALTAMRKKMDLLGVIVLGVVTAVGGGMIRDILLGISPPLAFRNPLAVICLTRCCLLWIRSGWAFSASWASGMHWIFRPSAAHFFWSLSV